MYTTLIHIESPLERKQEKKDPTIHRKVETVGNIVGKQGECKLMLQSVQPYLEKESKSGPFLPGLVGFLKTVKNTNKYKPLLTYIIYIYIYLVSSLGVQKPENLPTV